MRHGFRPRIESRKEHDTRYAHDCRAALLGLVVRVQRRGGLLVDRKRNKKVIDRVVDDLHRRGVDAWVD